MSPSSAHGLQSLHFHNLAFTVSDIEKTIHWYETTLGFKVLSRTAFPAANAQIAFLQLADIQLEVLQTKDGFRLDAIFADAPNHLLPIGNKSLVLQVNDLHQATVELEEKGVTFAWKEVDLSGEGHFSTMIRDNDGNFITSFREQQLRKLSAQAQAFRASPRSPGRAEAYKPPPAEPAVCSASTFLAMAMPLSAAGKPAYTVMSSIISMMSCGEQPRCRAARV